MYAEKVIRQETQDMVTTYHYNRKWYIAPAISSFNRRAHGAL